MYEELERRRRGGASSPGQAAASAAAGRKYNTMDNLMITFAVVVRLLFYPTLRPLTSLPLFPPPLH